MPCRPDQREKGKCGLDVVTSRVRARSPATGPPPRTSFIPGSSTRRCRWCIAWVAISFAMRSARDLLPVFNTACAAEQRRTVDRTTEGVEPGLRERRGLADHPVGRRGAEGQLQADPSIAACNRDRRVERACERRARIRLVVAADEADVRCPRRSLGVLCRRSRQISTGSPSRGKTQAFVPLHAPEVREVENVVGRAHDERVEPVLGHQGTDALELRLVSLPGHRNRLRGNAPRACAARGRRRPSSARAPEGHRSAPPSFSFAFE